MKICDEFDLFHLEQDFLNDTFLRLKNHPLLDQKDLKKLEKGEPLAQIENAVNEDNVIPKFLKTWRWLPAGLFQNWE